MKKLFFIAMCIICAECISLVIGVLVLRHVHDHKMNNKSGTVYIQKILEGYEIIRNGKLFNIRGAANNILFVPNELKNAELIFTNAKIDSLKIVWEIYSGFWNVAEGEIKSVSEKSIDSFISFENQKASFIAPAIVRPYRIFAYVYD